MNLQPVTLRLDTDEVQLVLQIALDGDAPQAVTFIREVLAKKVEKALQRH